MTALHDAVASIGSGTSDQSPPRRPRVLHARLVTGTGGGPDKTILASPAFLKPLGTDATCLYLRPADDPGFDALRRRAAAADVELLEIDDGGPLDWTIPRRTAARLQGDPPDIWHGHDYKTNLLGLLLRRRFPDMGLVTTVHGWVLRTWKTPLYHAIDRWCLRRYDAVLCVSEDLRRTCAAAGVPADRLRLVRNAIDTDAFRPSADLRSDESGTTRAVTVGAAGRLRPEKGFDLLLRSIAALTADRRPRLRIAGEGPEENRLRQLAIDLGIADRVEFCGFVADVRGFFATVDLFVLSSRREGLPNVVLEAMACGVPVVATAVAEVPAVLGHGAFGTVVAPEDVGAMTVALERLIADPAQRRALAMAGRQRVCDRYDFRSRMNAVADLYRAVLTRKPLPE